MPVKFTRETGRIDLSKLEPGQYLGGIPIDGLDEESVTIKIVKKIDGARLYIRNTALPDRTTSYSVEIEDEKELIDEVTDISRTFISGLFHRPTRWKEVPSEKPGVLKFEEVTSGPSPDFDKVTLERRVIAGIKSLRERGYPVTIALVAEFEFRWTETNLRYHMRKHRLNFRELKKRQ